MSLARRVALRHLRTLGAARSPSKRRLERQRQENEASKEHWVKNRSQTLKELIDLSTKLKRALTTAFSEEQTSSLADEVFGPHYRQEHVVELVSRVHAAMRDAWARSVSGDTEVLHALKDSTEGMRNAVQVQRVIKSDWLRKVEDHIVTLSELLKIKFR